MQPGLFFAWVIADGIMHKIPIIVPRVFYLNSKASITEEFPGRRVNKILPHSRPVFNLIEVFFLINSLFCIHFLRFSLISLFYCYIKVSIGEDQFRTESRKLAIHLSDPEVEVFLFLPFSCVNSDVAECVIGYFFFLLG